MSWGLALTHTARAAPPTKMGYFLRSLRRRADSQPAEEAAKPRKLQKKKQPPRVTRAESSESRTEPAALDQPAREQQLPANDDDGSITTPKGNEALEEAMKPIGEYPSAAEYKSVGLTPPAKHVTANKRAKLALTGDEEVMTDTPTTPRHANEDVGARVDGNAPLCGVENAVSLKGSVEDVLEENVVGEVVDVDAVPSTKLATTPTSEAVGPQTALSSLFPGETPADTTADETMTDLVPTVPDTHITPPEVETQSPPVTTTADGMVSDSEKVISRDFIAVLNSLPVPASNAYDTHQLKRVLEFAISHSHNVGDDDVALSLVHYWSDISGDEFKLSLIHNIGCENVDHNLELALKAMLRHSLEDATKWYQAYSLERAEALLRQSSESALSSARSPGAEPLGQTPFKAADIYRETSGPRLEEAFLTGKTNTAPLKRPRKPVPVNENSFKRRREWEADPTLEETLREKRARLSEDVTTEDEVLQRSEVRPQRGPPDQAEELPSQCQQSRPQSLPAEDTAADEAQATAVSSTTTTTTTGPRSQRAAKGQMGKGKKHQQAKGGRAGPSRRGRAAADRTQSVPVGDSDYETDATHFTDNTHPCYSEKARGWNAGYSHRMSVDPRYGWFSCDISSSCFRMLTLALSSPPENMDDCYNCDRGGQLLCCDSCENALHFTCVSPPLDPKNPPEGEWHCDNCEAQDNATTLVRDFKESKKTEFIPEKRVRTYFAGVGEHETDTMTSAGNRPDLHLRAYTNVPHLPRLTKPPTKNPHESLAYNDPELLKLFENGRPILCCRCGLGSRFVRPIIRCDYCESRFHLDCLDPPLAVPPNPYKGWMCPNHIRPDDLIMSKMVDGRLQERRVRRPKNLVTVDADVLTTDDFRETNFDEDWRETRARLPAGDLIMDFVTAVKQERSNREREFFDNVTSAALNVAKEMTKEHLTNMGVSSNENAIPKQLASGITSAVENLRTRAIHSEEYDAASVLLGLAQSEPTPTVGDPPATVSSQDIARPQSRASSTATATARKKRSRAESEADTTEAREPAQKRQHTESD